MKLDINQVLDNMTNRFASKVATLEREVAILMSENQQLKEELSKTEEQTIENKGDDQ